MINNNYIDFTNKFKLKSHFQNDITKVGSQLNHIWTNTLIKNQCKSRVMESIVWQDFHKPIYMGIMLG